jgi:hypothetical protein
VTVVDNTPIDVAELDQSRPVEIGGSGVLQASTQELFLNVVTIQPDSDFVARGLVVQSSLHLEAGAKLEAAPFHKIDLGQDIELQFTCPNAAQLPSLDLGEIGDIYTVVPTVLQVDIGSTEISADLHAPLVQGKTMSNCEEWRAKVQGLPSGFEATCETISRAAQSLLAGGPVIGLFVVKSKPLDPDGGLSGGAVAGIVISLLVVAGVAVGAAWWFFVRKKDDDDSGKASA